VSKAFTKEDDDIPERALRMRSRSGLPPGAANYMTADGAARLRAELGRLPEGSERAAQIAEILASATVVNPPVEPPEGAVFGAWMELRAGNGGVHRRRIVGADETGLDPEAVSWASPPGRQLLGREIGDTVLLELEGVTQSFTVARIWY
jgi:transcription elongation GreA/GreB family factor